MMLTELLLLISLGMGLASIFIPDWLSGSSSTYMYPSGTSQGFESRSYGLVYVEGQQKQTWAEVAGSVCDRWGLYAHTSTLYPIAAICESSSVGDDVKCTESFETHLRSRCEVYSNMTLLSFIVIGVLSFANALIALTSILMLLVPIAQMKRSLLASLSSSIVLVTGGLVSYALCSFFWFKRLNDNSTFPMPTISLGFIVGAVGNFMLIAGTFVLYRLSAGLKYTPNKNHVAHKALLDLAEAKLLDSGSFEGDTDDEDARPRVVYADSNQPRVVNADNNQPRP
jgi:hypothetical protein